MSPKVCSSVKLLQSGFLGSRRKSKGHNGHNQHVPHDLRDRCAARTQSTPQTRLLRTLLPRKTNGWKLKINPIEQQKHLQTHQLFEVPAVQLSFFFPCNPPPGDLGATTFAKGCSCSCRPQGKFLLVFMASIVSCRTTKLESQTSQKM